MIQIRNASLYCIAGTVAALGFAPFNLFPFFIASLAWLFAQLISRNFDRENFRNSFLFFLCLHVFSLYWLVYPLTLDLKRHWVLIPFAVIAIPAYFSLWLSCACGFVRFFSNICSKALIFSSAICAATYAYGHFSLGFPWILPAYIWNIHEIFMQTLSIWGPYGLGLMTVLISALIGITVSFGYKSRDGKVALFSSLFIFGLIVVFGFTNLGMNNTEF